ncbi:MAG: hypothetical protein ACXV8T_09660 [Acidimicrobiia bacterium]
MADGAAPDDAPGYWPSRWPGEDGGPRRTEIPRSGTGLGLGPGEWLEVTTREVVVGTMAVLRDPGEVYLLRHTGGPDAISWVERIDPTTLETIERSPDLPGGKTWPGGVAAHANGDVYVVFGRHAHRLSADLQTVHTVELPRDRPYNSFVILPDGHLALKDFGGTLPPGIEQIDADSCELLVLEPEQLAIVARVVIPERSIARLSADGDDVYVVGVEHLWRVRWDGAALAIDRDFTARYRTIEGQTYGWDAVIAGGAAWFLDDGEGTEGYAGSFRGVSRSPAPLHLVRVDLPTGAVTLTEVCGLPNGIVANPPAIDAGRGIAVGYDSANGVLAAFAIDTDGTLTPRWRREQHHACHPILYADTGELVTADHDADRFMDQLVVLDIETGEEKARVDTGSPLQSVVFLAPGFGRDLYYVAFPVVARIAVTGP